MPRGTALAAQYTPGEGWSFEPHDLTLDDTMRLERHRIALNEAGINCAAHQIGMPGYPAPPEAVEAMATYETSMLLAIYRAQLATLHQRLLLLFPQRNSSPACALLVTEIQDLRQKITKIETELSSRPSRWTTDKAFAPYPPPEGDPRLFADLVGAWNRIFGLKGTPDALTRDNVVLTMGGANALSCVNALLRRERPPDPHPTFFVDPRYALYESFPKPHITLPTTEGGLFPSGAAISKKLHELADAGTPPAVLIFCIPNNPTAACPKQDELEQIILAIGSYLKKHPEYRPLVVMDESYRELGDDIGGTYPTAICLKNKFLAEGALEQYDDVMAFLDQSVCVRSATKAYSLSAKRIAVAITHNPKLAKNLTATRTEMCGPPDVTPTLGYVVALEQTAEELENPPVGGSYLDQMRAYYRMQAEFVFSAAQAMRINVYPIGHDPKKYGSRHRIGFYEIVNLHEFMGYREMGPITAKCFGKPVGSKVENAEELAYALMEGGGAIPSQGYALLPMTLCSDSPLQRDRFRVTCDGDLDKLMTALCKEITAARLSVVEENTQLVDLLHQILPPSSLQMPPVQTLAKALAAKQMLYNSLCRRPKTRDAANDHLDYKIAGSLRDVIDAQEAYLSVLRGNLDTLIHEQTERATEALLSCGNLPRETRALSFARTQYNTLCATSADNILPSQRHSHRRNTVQAGAELVKALQALRDNASFPIGRSHISSTNHIAAALVGGHPPARRRRHASRSPSPPEVVPASSPYADAPPSSPSTADAGNSSSSSDNDGSFTRPWRSCRSKKRAPAAAKGMASDGYRKSGDGHSDAMQVVASSSSHYYRTMSGSRR